jgi:hypothetical protein
MNFKNKLDTKFCMYECVHVGQMNGPLKESITPQKLSATITLNCILFTVQNIFVLLCITSLLKSLILVGYKHETVLFFSYPYFELCSVKSAFLAL